jgi:hypothetical protein
VDSALLQRLLYLLIDADGKSQSPPEQAPEQAPPQAPRQVPQPRSKLADYWRNGWLVVEDREAPDGRFHDLEAFCQSAGIPFDRWSSALHGPARVAVCRSRQPAVVFDQDSSGRATVPRCEIMRLLRHDWHAAAALKQALSWLARADLQPLPRMSRSAVRCADAQRMAGAGQDEAVSVDV